MRLPAPASPASLTASLASLAITLALLTPGLPTPARAHGINGHIHVTGWAIESLPPGPLADLFTDPDAFDAALFGASFPDTGYAIDDPYGEMAHWPPFLEAYLRHLRATLPPPYDTPEKRRHVAFVMGLASHGLQDEIFDSIFLHQIAEHDGRGQDEADPGTDAMLFVDGYLRFKPPQWAPVDDLIEVFAAEGHRVDADTIEAGMTRVKVVVIDGFAGIGAVFDRRYRPLLPWTAEHYVDPAIPGSLASEIPATRAFIEAVWERLHGRFPAAGFVAHPYPDGRRRLQSADPATVSSWVTLVLGIGARVGTINAGSVTLEGPDGAVPFELRHTRWSGGADDWTRIIQLRPQVALSEDSEYTVRLAAGIELIDGSLLAEPWQYRFRTRCADDAACAPEPADGGVLPVDAAVVDATGDAMAGDAADVMAPDAMVTDATAPDAIDATAPDATIDSPAAAGSGDGCHASPATGADPAVPVLCLLALAVACTRRRR